MLSASWCKASTPGFFGWGLGGNSSFLRSDQRLICFAPFDAKVDLYWHSVPRFGVHQQEACLGSTWIPNGILAGHPSDHSGNHPVPARHAAWMLVCPRGIDLPSGNHTWQWKIHHLEMFSSIKLNAHLQGISKFTMFDYRRVSSIPTSATPMGCRAKSICPILAAHGHINSWPWNPSGFNPLFVRT